MDNMAKASTFNSAVSDATQKTKLQNILALIFIGFIVLILTVGAVLIAFIVTGGVKTAVDGAVAAKGQSGGSGGLDMSTLEGLSSEAA
jgi:hypothetical protein